MPRKKKADLNALAENFMSELEARFTHLLKQEMAEVFLRLEKIERDLAIRKSRDNGERLHKICNKSGCRSQVVAHGLCSRHYQQWRYHKKKAERLAAQKQQELDAQQQATSARATNKSKKPKKATRAKRNRAKPR